MRKKNWTPRNKKKRNDFSTAYFKYSNQGDNMISPLLSMVPFYAQNKTQILTMASKAVHDPDFGTSDLISKNLANLLFLKPLVKCPVKVFKLAVPLFLKSSSPKYSYSIVLASFKSLFSWSLFWQHHLIQFTFHDIHCSACSIFPQ